MKLIGNPWVVGLLGLGAVVVVVFNTFHPHGPQMPTPATGRSATTVVINSLPSMPGATGTPESPASPAPQPTMNIDSDYVRSHLIDWMSVTQRDPFFLAKATGVTTATNVAVPQITQLKLKAIWRQDGVSMAAIDKGIYRVGDNVEGRKIERFIRNGVWLEYNGKKELVVFEGLDGSNTNTP